MLLKLKLKFYGIKNYTINSNGTIDVNGDVDLRSRNLSKLPFTFGKVTGYFLCNYNNLTSLIGAPESVGKSFYCRNNKLTSLAGAPKSVGRNFGCDDNYLTTLFRAPESVGGDFWCDNNKRQLNGKPLTEKEVREASNVEGN